MERKILHKKVLCFLIYIFCKKSSAHITVIQQYGENKTDCIVDHNDGPIGWLSHNLNESVIPSIFNYQEKHLKGSNPTKYPELFPTKIDFKWENWTNSIHNKQEIFGKPYQNFSGTFSVLFKTHQEILSILNDEDEIIYNITVQRSSNSNLKQDNACVLTSLTDRWFHFNIVVDNRLGKLKIFVKNNLHCQSEFSFSPTIKFKNPSNGIWKMKENNDIFIDALDINEETKNQCFSTEIIGGNISIQFLINKNPGKIHTFEELERKTVHVCSEEGFIVSLSVRKMPITPNYIFGVNEQITFHNSSRRKLTSYKNNNKQLICLDINTNEKIQVKRIPDRNKKEENFDNTCNIPEEYFSNSTSTICCKGNCYIYETKTVILEKVKIFLDVGCILIIIMFIGLLVMNCAFRKRDEGVSESSVSLV